MSKGKLEKFAEVNTFPNVLQNVDYHQTVLINHEGKPKDLKGKWASYFFGNENPIVLELACGGGEYTTGLAEFFPEKNFIGIDLKGNRVWKGAKAALQKKIMNAAFIRSRIELLENYFSKNEVSEIWITFPDPYLKKSKSNKRLTSPFFLNIYRKICEENAVLHLKTDSRPLFEFSLKTLKEEGCKILQVSENIYQNGECTGALAIKTYYEKMHLEEGRTITYIQFSLH